MTQAGPYYGMDYKMLSQTDIEAIHEATLQVMHKTGIRMKHKEAQEILAGVGCEIDTENNIVHFPPNVVNDAIKALPEFDYIQYGRDPSRDYRVRKNEVRFSNSGICPSFIDPETGERRTPTLEDVATTARVVDALDVFENYMIAVPACDVPPDIMDLYQTATILKNTSKSFCNMQSSAWILKYQIRMLELVAGGKEAYQKRPFMSLNCTTISPLEILPNELDMIIIGVRAGMSPNIFNDTMAGSTAPATLAGTMVVINAEILAGLTLAQAVKKGTRVTYGTSSGIMDFRTMTFPIGAPEHAMVSTAAVQMAQYYNMPSVSGAT